MWWQDNADDRLGLSEDGRERDPLRASEALESRMKGRTVLVTGSTDGIGRQTALQLAKRGAFVLVHGRSPERGRRALEEIRRMSGSDRLELFVSDLSSMAQVRRLAADVAERHDQLHVLINNAGTFQRERTLTEDGLETTFAVNYMAPFLLTHGLLDLLRRNAPARVINVASAAHWNAHLDWRNLQGERDYDGFSAYASSKLALILFTYALARRLQGTGVTANCLHPGVIRTKLLSAGFGDHPGGTPERGARTSVYLACSPEVEQMSGRYFERCTPISSSPSSYSQDLQERLWRVSEGLAGVG
ncbi:MAG: SDR family oxidoreductase [Methanothrix sp.]|nr:SDR family oxidoreductase [Methanothrix sp.]